MRPKWQKKLRHRIFDHRADRKDCFWRDRAAFRSGLKMMGERFSVCGGDNNA